MINVQCTGYSYQPTPLENKCALLGAVIPSEVCLVPKQIFQQQPETNVNCNSTFYHFFFLRDIFELSTRTRTRCMSNEPFAVCPLPKNVQSDSCIDSFVSPLAVGPDMCTRLNVSGRNASYYIIRWVKRCPFNSLNASMPARITSNVHIDETSGPFQRNASRRIPDDAGQRHGLEIGV